MKINHFTISVKSKLPLSLKKIKPHLKHQSKLNWKSFSELFECQNSFWEVEIADDCDVTN